MDCQQRYQGQAALDRTSEVDRNGKHFRNKNESTMSWSIVFLYCRQDVQSQQRYCCLAWGIKIFYGYWLSQHFFSCYYGFLTCSGFYTYMFIICIVLCQCLISKVLSCAYFMQGWVMMWKRFVSCCPCKFVHEVCSSFFVFCDEEFVWRWCSYSKWRGSRF